MAEAEKVCQLYKIIIVGEAAVGKTSLVKRYTENIYSNKYRYTIGVDFALKVIEWETGVAIKLQIWDIAGQERFGTMTHVYYKEAAGACLVFDISSSKSFQAAQRWKQDINSKVTLPNGEPVPTILFANKCDLDPAEHQVSDSDINKFCSDNSCIAWWMKTSAKDNINIDKGMKLLLSKMISNPVAVTKTAPPLELHLNSTASESHPTLQEPQKRCC